MTHAIETKPFARVVVIAPRTRVDLALPVDIPIVDLLPMLLDLVGERSDAGGGLHGGWQLSRVDGGAMGSDQTLRSLDIVDGTALHLTPRETNVAPPIYDDTVDAIAATIRSSMSTRSTNPAAGACGAAVGLAIAALALLYKGNDNPVNTYLALASALLALGAGTAIARGPRERVIATTVAAGGLPFAFVAGIAIVPGHIGPPGYLLGFALMLIYSFMALMALATGTVVFVTGALISLFGLGAAIVCTAADVKPLYTVAGTAAIGIAAIATLPWLVVRLARLPLPFIPTSGSEIRNDDTDIDIGQLTARARLADEYLNGGYIGCAAVVAFSSAAVALHGSLMSVLLACACMAALLLRIRSIVSMVPRAAIIAVSLGTILAAGVVEVAGLGRTSSGLFAAALGVAGAAVLLSVVVPRVRISPVTLRFVDFVEAAVLISILPLAVGVMNLYSTLRHL